MNCIERAELSQRGRRVVNVQIAVQAEVLQVTTFNE